MTNNFEENQKEGIITEIKQKRARSKEKKSKKFEEIIDTGIDLYCSRKFSLLKLAKQMNMSMSNLYHYVQSKRELWIAIRKKFLNDLQVELQQIVITHEGTYIELFMKLAEFFLKYSATDYRRFDFMFMIPAPYSEKIGPIEKSYKPFNLISILEEVVQKSIESGEIKEKSATKLTFFFYQIILGAAIVEKNLSQLKENVLEPTQLSSNTISVNEIREYFLNQTRKHLTLLSL